MNVVKIMGGLGNQLWQYNFGQYIEKHSGKKTVYDLEWYTPSNARHRPYLLDKYDIEVPITVAKPSHFVNEKSIQDNVLDFSKDTHYFGYWQNKVWLEDDTTAMLREKIVPVGSSQNDQYRDMLAEIRLTKSVGVHVRRGDFIIKRCTILPAKYFQDGIRLARLFGGDVTVFVFSEDIEWCKENIKDSVIVDIKQPHLALDLLKECKAKVISNSTFSWWACHLNPTAQIIAPQSRPMADGGYLPRPSWEPDKVYMDNWLKIAWV